MWLMQRFFHKNKKYTALTLSQQARSKTQPNRRVKQFLTLRAKTE
jgi:hypothetical protein